MDKISDSEFIGNARFLQEDYLNLLDLDVRDSTNKGHPFYDDYQNLLTHQAHPVAYNDEFSKMLMLFESLEAIKKIRPSEFELIKKRLTGYKNNVGLFGDKFELLIEFTFINKMINYVKQESPDFKINDNNMTFFIECTSAQFDFEKAPTKPEIFTKLRTKIIDKMKEPYANRNTALFIDITNLRFHSEQLNAPLTEEEITRTLNNASDKSKNTNEYGVIVFFYFEFSNDINQARFNAWRTIIRQNVKSHILNNELHNFIVNNLMADPGATKSDLPKFH